MTTRRELDEQAVLDQAAAFLDYQRKLGGSWRASFALWLDSKDFGPADTEALMRVLCAVKGEPRVAA